MTNKNFDVYFDLGSSKIRATAFKKNSAENFVFENECLSVLNVKKLDLSKTEYVVEKTISQIEKKTDEYLDDINLLVDSVDTLPIGLSLAKEIDNKKIDKEEIQYLIQSAKQQILKSNTDYEVLHILITNYKINNINYPFLPIDKECNHLSIDILFICFPKMLIKNLEDLFHKKDVSIKQILFSSYTKSLNYKDQFGFHNKSAFIDMGYEKTSIIYYKNQNFYFFHILPVGSHHITKDISKILNIDLIKSEKAKLNFDKDNNFLRKNKLSLELIKKIIFARVEEILEISTKFISDKENVDNLEQLRLVLMGEGSKIIANRYKQDISITNDIDLFDETAFDICESGLKLIEGQNKQEVVIIPKRPKKKGFFEKLFHLFK